MVALLAERGVEPLLIDDRPDRAAAQLDLVVGPGRPVLDPGRVPWGAVDVVVRAPGVSRYRPELAAAAAGWGHGHHGHGRVAGGLRRRPGGGHHRHQGQEHHGGPDRRPSSRPVRPGGGADRQHRGAGDRGLRPAAGRRLRGRGLLVPGLRGHRDPRGVPADQPGPRPPGLARRRGALLPGQAPAHRGRATRGPGRQRRQRRGGARAPRRTPTAPCSGPAGRVRVDGSGSVVVDDEPLGDPAAAAGPGAAQPVEPVRGHHRRPAPRRPHPSGRRRRTRRWPASTGCRPGARRWGSATGSPSSTMPWPPTPSPRWPHSEPSPIGS